MSEKDFRVRKGLVVDGTGTSSIAGSLGIGTTSPVSLLHLHKNAYDFDDGVQDEDGDFHLMLKSGQTSTAGDAISIGFAQTSDGTTVGAKISHVIENSFSRGALVFSTNNTASAGDTTEERMRITGAGNVGIGTTSPDTILHVSSATHPSIRITGTDNAGADPAIEMLGQGNSFSEGMQMWYDNGAGVAHIASLYDNSAADIQFHTRTGADRSTSNVRMTIEGDGNVGIGTTTPSTKLEVDGTVTATGFSGTVQPKSTVASAGNNTANYYAKLMTFDPEGNNHRDANAILAITTKDNGANGSAIIHVKFRSNGASDDYTTDVSFISKSGNAIFNNNAFQIWSTGNGGGGNTEVMELWVQKNTSYTGLDVHEVSLDKSGSCTVTYNSSASWQSAAPTTTQQTTTQGIEMGLDVTVDGSLSATTKSFDIEHPTKEGMRLHHGSLEGPEHGVYHRGVGASSVVELPDYWTGLVDEDSITVQLTPKGSFQQLFVRKVEGNKVHVDAVDGGELSFYYNIYGTRKDVDKMEVEY